MSMRRLIHRWFVQYNPLYFASALCVLAGVLLLSEGFSGAGAGSGSGGVGLTAVLEFYQWLLIGAAALLFRREGQRRPAVILGIVTMVYLGDPTFQIEGMALLGLGGLLPSLLWVGSVALKLRALVWAFRLRLSPSFFLATLFGAAGLALLPHLETSLPMLSGGSLPIRQIFAGAILVTVYGVGAVLVTWRAGLSSRETLDAWGQTVLRRTRKAAAFVWIGLAAYHLAAWSLNLGTEVLPSLLAAGVLVAALRQSREFSIWARIAGALGLGLLGDPALFPVVLTLAASTGLLLGWRRSPRMLVATVFFAYLTAVVVLQQAGQVGVLPWVTLLLLVPLALLIWRKRAWSGFVAAALMALDLGVRLELLREPQGPLEWGATLLVVGFVFLATGLAVNLWGVAPEPAPPSGPAPPERHLRVL